SPARPETDDPLALGPRLLREDERHAGGLAGGRRRDQDGRIATAQRGGELREHSVDGKRRVEDHGAAEWNKKTFCGDLFSPARRELKPVAAGAHGESPAKAAPGIVFEWVKPNARRSSVY